MCIFGGMSFRGDGAGEGEDGDQRQNRWERWWMGTSGGTAGNGGGWGPAAEGLGTVVLLEELADGADDFEHSADS